MPLTRKALALSIGLLGMISAVTIAQGQKSNPADSQLVIEDNVLQALNPRREPALAPGSSYGLVVTGPAAWPPAAGPVTTRP